MPAVRMVARLDIKGPNLIKGIQLEGLRVLGQPQTFSSKYYNEGVDELIFIDIVASLYQRNQLQDIIQLAAENIFVPITVGGGIRSVENVRELLRCGADKVAINTAAIKRPELIKEVAERFGSQCMVLSIEAKRDATTGKWEAFTDNGREHTGLDVIEWAKQGQKWGAGEILLTSVDQEGTRRGFDVNLVKAVTDVVTIPVIASGGMGSIDHFVDVVKQGRADAVAMADVLHYNRLTLPEIRNAVRARSIEVRSP